jgi:asparagine synthase (glutamine-hydrolysing)
MNYAEIATNLVLGTDPAQPRLPRLPGSLDEVRRALEQAVLPALLRPPCLVAFSGGVDSSAVLAAAVLAARKHGLALPIPATNRFPGIPEVDESAWQELVVNALGLSDWVRIDMTDELDLIGPVAQPGLVAHGVMWPPNAHFLLPVIQRANGGTVLTGLGGDELFTPSSQRVPWVLTRRLRPRRSDVREVCELIMPAGVRRALTRRQLAAPEWLHPDGQLLWREALARELSGGSLWWGRSIVDSWWPSRNRIAATRSIQALAGTGAVVDHPFMTPEFVARLAASRWKTGFRSRAEAVQFLLGDALPLRIRQRSDKAAFFRPFINRHSGAFIEQWDGTGVDENLVNVERLREIWGQPEVDGRSYSCLQAAWLAQHRP